MTLSILAVVALVAAVPVAIVALDPTADSSAPPIASPAATPSVIAFGRPLISGRSVFTFEGAELVARDVNTRAKVWATRTCGAPLWADETRANPTGALYVRCERDLLSIDPRTGRHVWSITVPMPAPTLIRADGPAVIVERNSLLYSLNALSGEVEGAQNEAGTFRPYPVDVRDDVVYRRSEGYMNGVLQPTLLARHLGDPRAGSEATYQWDIAATPTAIAATTHGLFMRTEDHALVRVDEAAHTVMWALPKAVETGPMTIEGASSDTVVTREGDAGVLTGYDANTGAQRWRLPESTAAAVGAHHVVVTQAHGLTILDAASGSQLHADAASRPGVPTVGTESYAFVDAQTGSLVVQGLP